VTTLAADIPERITQPVQFRYGAVFVLVLALLVFETVAPDGAGTRAIAIALAGAALTVSVATSRARSAIRRARARGVAIGALCLVVGVATGLLSSGVADAVLALVAAAVPVALAGGLLRLIREHGVTGQAVAGALAIYLLVGLLFAFVVGFVAHIESTPYFKQGDITNGDHVYYSFTVLTTTGFGDYTPATPTGHALAVLEMLTGQLYLVTVIGILVGNFAGRRMRGDRA
jgi:Ion channel